MSDDEKGKRRHIEPPQWIALIVSVVVLSLGVIFGMTGLEVKNSVDKNSTKNDQQDVKLTQLQDAVTRLTTIEEMQMQNSRDINTTLDKINNTVQQMVGRGR